jgi:hypothetical protein
MKFLPRNRRLLLHKVGTEETQKEQKDVLSGFALPEGVDPRRKGTEIYKVLDKSPDVTLDVSVGDFIVVEESMVNKRVYGDIVYYHIVENYVEGVLEGFSEGN